MQLIDMFIGVFIILGFILGFMKGFVHQSASLLGLIAGLLLARMFYDMLGEQLAPVLGTSCYYAKIIAFVIIALVVPIFFALIGSLLTRFLKAIRLNFINRLFGALLGGVTALLIIGTVICIYEQIDVKNRWLPKTTKEESALYYPVQKLSAYIIGNSKAMFFDAESK